MNNDVFSARLDRIEEKLDQLAEAMNRLAMMEERLVHYHNSMSQLDERLDDHETRMRKMETVGLVISNIERFVWFMMTSGIGILAWFVSRGGV